MINLLTWQVGRLRLKCDGTRAETRFRLLAKRTSPFKSAGASVQSTTGSRGVRISGSNAGYNKFRGSVKGFGYPLHSPVSPFTSPSCVAVCHRVSTGLYQYFGKRRSSQLRGIYRRYVAPKCVSAYPLRKVITGCKVAGYQINITT